MIATKYIIMGVIVIGAIALFVNFAKFLMPSKKRRSSDKNRPKNRTDRRIYGQAMKLAKQDPVNAAKLLESIHLHREAIDLLEGAGRIREAAGILNRMGRPNRAAIILRRYELWKDASLAFEKAGMQVEAAECAKKSGDIARALTFYKAVEDTVEVADCHLELGNYHEAAKAFVSLNEVDRALSMYSTLLQKNPSIDQMSFTQAEIKFIQKHVMDNAADRNLIKILIKEQAVVDTISALSNRGEIDLAAKIYLECSFDMAPDLVAGRNLTRAENLNLALLFEKVANFEYSGMMYERLEEFSKAGEAFAKAEMYERAAYAFDRCGERKKAIEMRCILAEKGGDQRKIQRNALSNAANPFIFDPHDVTESRVMEQNSIEPARLVLGDEPANPTSEFSNVEDTNIVMNSPESGHDLPPDPPDHFSNLRKTPLIAALSEEEKKALLALGELKIYESGTRLFESDHEKTGIHLIIQGAIECSIRDGDDWRVIHTETEGGSLGELWVLAQKPWADHYIAKGRVRTLFLPEAALSGFIQRNPLLGQRLYRQMAQILIKHLSNPETRGLLAAG